MGKGKSGMSATPGSYTDNANALTQARGDYIGDKSIRDQAADYLNYHLGENEEYVRVDDFKIIQNPTNSGLADVDVDYSVDVRIPETDYETGETYYETETEYRQETLQLRVLKK